MASQIGYLCGSFSCPYYFSNKKQHLGLDFEFINLVIFLLVYSEAVNQHSTEPGPVS